MFHETHKDLLVSWLVLWAQSTKKNYIRAKHKFHSITESFISQVIIPQVLCFLEPIDIPRAHSTRKPASSRVTIYSAGLHRNQLTQENLRKLWEKNAGEWTGRVEISKEEIPGSKCNVYGYTHWPTPGFKRRISKLCVPNRWDLISASAAPHCRSHTGIILWLFLQFRELTNQYSLHGILSKHLAGCGL